MPTSAHIILTQYNTDIQTLANKLGSFLINHLPDIQEIPDVPGNILGYGYGPGYKDTICAIIPSKKGVKLGFYKGVELPDPQKLLTGTGKVHKYVAINSETDIDNPALLHLLQAALKAYKERSK